MKSPADGKDAAPVADGDKKEGEEKKAPDQKKNNQLIIVKIPRVRS